MYIICPLPYHHNAGLMACSWAMSKRRRSICINNTFTSQYIYPYEYYVYVRYIYAVRFIAVVVFLFIYLNCCLGYSLSAEHVLTLNCE